MSPPYTALITGSNGITGQAMVSAILAQPSSKWARIIITSRSPLRHSASTDPRLSGLQLDLSAPVSQLTRSLQNFDGIEEVTHFYHCAYIHEIGEKGMCNPMVNVEFFSNVLKAVDAVCGKLERVFLQCGAKYYGVHIGNPKAFSGEPIREEDGRYGGDDSIFYYRQVDFMKRFGEGKSWSWNFGNPFWVYGPSHGNGMSFGTTMAIILTVLKYLHLQGKAPNTAFPSTPQLYSGAYSLSGSKGIGEFQEWLTTQPNTRNEFFNVVDGCEVTLGQIWESMCDYFGIPTSPPAKDRSSEWNVETFMEDKKEVWNEIVRTYGGRKEAFDWGTFDTARSAMSDLQLVASMEKAKKFGFNKVYDTRKELNELFNQMTEGGDLPKFK